MIYSNILESLKKIILDENALFNCVPCPDSRRGIIEYKGNKFSYKNSENDNCHKKLIFILESPHKGEFNEDFSPIAPAQGITGKRFEETLVNVCILAQYHHSAFNEGIYEVWLINAIQYQVSLGLKTKEYRSVLFQIVWFSFGELEFINRIKELVKNSEESVIINSCTKANELKKIQGTNLLNQLGISSNIKPKICLEPESIDLRNLIDSAVRSCNFSNKYFRASHPVKWDILVNEANKKIQRVV